MTVSRFIKLPLADRSRAWNGSAADKRVRAFTGAKDAPTPKYRNAHVWYDGDNADEFTAYKLLIADVVDGELTAIPRAIFAAAVVVDGGRTGLNVPDSDRPKIKKYLERYYAAMGETAPWKKSAKAGKPAKATQRKRG